MSKFKMAAYNFYGSQRNNNILSFNILFKNKFYWQDKNVLWEISYLYFVEVSLI